jgi:hypothetical protein
MMNTQPSIANSEQNKTRKIMVLTIHRRDYELLETMLANGREKLPDLEMEGVVSAIVAEACRCHREHNQSNARTERETDLGS